MTTGSTRSFAIEADAAGTIEAAELDINVVSPTYLHAMQMTLLEGRLFDKDDRERGSPVVVVDERLASRYFGGHITGRFLRDATGKRYAIVGMVKSGAYRTLQESPRPTVYIPHTQEFAQRSYLFVRTTGDPAPMLPGLVTDLQALDPDARIVRATTLQDHFSQTLVLDRMTLWLVGLSGLIALALASIGVYGVVSDAVQRRTREIGLRMVLGADRRRLASLVFLEALRPTAAGVGLGLVVLLLADRVARSFVYGIPAADVPTIAGAAAILLTVAVLAAAPPLRRALRVSPTVALRHRA